MKNDEPWKPPILYHGSTSRDIDIFLPSRNSFRDPQEGPVVFATQRKDLALCFCMPFDDSWMSVGIAADNVCEILIADRKKFKKLDKGGAVYTLPSDTFYCDPNKGMGRFEWVSRDPVKPITKSIYENIFEALIEFGVRVYFIDLSILREYRKIPGERKLEFIRRFKTENEKMG